MSASVTTSCISNVASCLCNQSSGYSQTYVVPQETITLVSCGWPLGNHWPSVSQMGGGGTTWESTLTLTGASTPKH